MGASDSKPVNNEELIIDQKSNISNYNIEENIQDNYDIINENELNGTNNNILLNEDFKNEYSLEEIKNISTNYDKSKKSNKGDIFDLSPTIDLSEITLENINDFTNNMIDDILYESYSENNKSLIIEDLDHNIDNYEIDGYLEDSENDSENSDSYESDWISETEEIPEILYPGRYKSLLQFKRWIDLDFKYKENGVDIRNLIVNDINNSSKITRDDFIKNYELYYDKMSPLCQNAYHVSLSTFIEKILYNFI